MNLRQPNANGATSTVNRSKDVVPSSGLCTTCYDGCKGGCEVFVSSFRGSEVLYPKPFGTTTSGADKEYPVDYSHLNIQGYAAGAEGLPAGIEPGPDTALFSAVDTRCSYGWNRKVELALPVFTGAMGSTDVARRNWDHLAAGAAISGITLVCGENVCGVDPELVLNAYGKVQASPEMDRRITTYQRYQEECGEILVQLNVEDTRLGVAEYVRQKHGLDTIELKWGQGAKCIGGEIKVNDLERARELRRRGYVVLPDPLLPSTEAAYHAGGVKQFERHSRLGFVDHESFMAEIQRLRGLGFSRITLKTGAYSAVELAQAMRFAAEAEIDLLTIDGAGGGTGMSPWPMMNEWGIPTFYLQSLAFEYAEKLTARGLRVPDLAIAGGFSTEDHVFKALAMGAPYFKAVCLGRALAIPAFVGKNIGIWLSEHNLPRHVAEHGQKVEEIFVCYEELREKFGAEITELPLGAIGLYSFCKKLRTGLQQLMAGARRFNLTTLGRRDLMSLTREASDVSGIPYVMDAYRDEAEAILTG